MSKRTKTKAAEKRKREKQARKKANQDIYQRWRDEGKNTKSKRFIKGRRKGPRARRHVQGSCGNPGCKTCYGVVYNPFLTVEGEARSMPQWMYQRFVAETGYVPSKHRKTVKNVPDTVDEIL